MVLAPKPSASICGISATPVRKPSTSTPGGRAAKLEGVAATIRARPTGILHTMIMSTHATEEAPASLALRSLNAYGEVAPEYYDPECHPTCANFADIHDRLDDLFRHYA